MKNIYIGESKTLTIKVNGNIESEKIQVWFDRGSTNIDKFSTDLGDSYKDIDSVLYDSETNKTSIAINLEYTDTKLYQVGTISVEVVVINDIVVGFEEDFRRIGRVERAFNMLKSSSMGV